MEEQVSSNMTEVAEPSSTETQETNLESTSVQAETPEVAAPEQKERDSDANKAFQAMRHKITELEKKATAADQWVKENFGQSHGLNTWEDYQNALLEAKRQEERQKFQQAGLPPEVADKLAKVDEIIKQSEQEKMDRLLLDNFDGLQKEYPDLVKTAQDIPGEVWQKWNDGKNGITLTEAYEIVNKQQIREHLQKATKQATLNNVNGKNHIRPNGGEGDDIDTTTVPDDVMAEYRKMFAKELKTGKMKESDFVKHYKKSQGK